MTYQPKYLLPAQVATESNGRQTNSDGTPVTSPKGAIGIAQVMPETGPAAAQLAGVPWDENKYKTDRDYNLQLGDAYQGHLNQIFNGHQLAATAAYNAGPTRVLRLKQQYGDNWASYLPTETKKYVKSVLGVDVDGQGGQSQYGPDGSNIDAIAKNLGIQLTPYKVAAPSAGETAQVNSGSDINSGPAIPDVGPAVATATAANKDASDKYTSFISGAIQPVIQNMAAQTQGYQQIAAVKHGMADDFRMRETDLESKIQPLMAKREQILTQIQSLDNLSPLDRRLKAVFNPMKYDPRELRGQLERVESSISGLDSNYTELNKLRTGVAAAAVDASSADIGVLDAARSSTLAEATLLGQVAGATRQQVDAALLPIQTAAQTMGLQEHQRAAMLGRMTGEMVHSLFNQATASPDGTVTVQGVKFTTGDLQDADRREQAQDLSLHSMINAHRVGDLETADKVEGEAISHMTYEQISQALADGGNYRGVKMSIPALTQGLATAQAARDQQVSGIIAGTATGQAKDIFTQQQALMSNTRGRAQEMFGNMPGEWGAFEQQVTGFATQWKKGMDAANAKGLGKDYLVTTMPQLQAMRTQYNTTVDAIAKRWGGGNSALTDVASSYLRGDPLNGEAATNGLIAIARSGMPPGSQLKGPAAQAVEAARSIVREFDNPQAGDSLATILKGSGSQAEKDRELRNRVRSAVGAVYANALTDNLIQSFPELARSIRDPDHPGMPHPFAQVNKDDFRMAIAHGDNSGYEVMGNQMGVTPQSAKLIFQKGVDSAEWKSVAQSKGWTNDKFATLLGTLQSLQMSETLSALDASHSAHSGFSPAKAYVDFLQNPEVQNHLAKAVQGYGQSNFGAFLVSGAAGGGYLDNWTAYTQAVGQQYFLNHGRDLQSKIKQQRSIGGDPFTRFNAVNRAIGLTPQESQLLMNNVRPLVSMPQDVGGPGIDLSEEGASTSARTNSMSQFDAVANIVRNHKFDDPTVERIRKKVAGQWDVMDSLVGTVFNSVSQ